jgi:YVTN family beta-propeller protein
MLMPSHLRLQRCSSWIALAALVLAGSAGASDFTNYESSHVHPVALSGDGRHLFAVNTPEARLSVFRVHGSGRLRFVRSVPVGLEPVSLAVRPGTDEVWVANHLSDSVSVVNAGAGRLIDTLQVGDEPNDVAFAGGFAFVCTSGIDDRVHVFDAVTRERVTDFEIFGEDPRAFAVSPDGSLVGLVVLESGNRTTNVPREAVLEGGGSPPPTPPRRSDLPGAAPRESLIVQYDAATGIWRDETGHDWSRFVPYSLPDYDLFLIDAAADPPFVTRRVSGIGTTLFDVAFHPKTGEVWVPNTDARNLIRFEPKLKGHLLETRVSIVDPAGGGVSHVELNGHIDYSVTPGPPGEIALSLSQPVNGVFDAEGHTFYLAALGSSTVAVLDGASGEVIDRIPVAGGPSGLALGSSRSGDRLYVMSRFEHTITVVDLKRRRTLQEVGVAGRRRFDPSPEAIQAGRHLLYDGGLSSGHGDLSCASCHLFGNWDALAWDLGDPQGDFVYYSDADWVTFAPKPTRELGFDPMKGPMATQTLRGLQGSEPFHWRGDRRDFQHFNGAFASLLGRGGPIPAEDMDLFADFIMTIEYPPNPFRNLDDSLPGPNLMGSPVEGERIFLEKETLRNLTCDQCHRLPNGTTNNLTGMVLDQDKKIPQLRNVYEKIGLATFRPTWTTNLAKSDQKRGYGLAHAGAFSLFEFLVSGFQLEGQEFGDVAAFLLAIETGTSACVGHQVTLSAETALDETSRSDLLVMAHGASLGKCDLIAHAHLDAGDVGLLWSPEEAVLLPNRTGFPTLRISELIDSLIGDDIVTFMGAPPGNGRRLALDRDRDQCLDGDEARFGSDPAYPGENRPDPNGTGTPDAPDRCPDG